MTGPTTLDGAVRALEDARRQTLRLTAFDDAALLAQPSPLMGPLVWDLAHVGQQEEHWLLAVGRGGYDPVFPREVAALYDAFEHPRATRARLPLLDAAAARRTLEDVRARVLDVLAGARDGTRARGGAAASARGGTVAGAMDGSVERAVVLAGMVAQHEQLHDETMLAAHNLRPGPPLLGAGPTAPAPARTAATGRSEADGTVLVPGGEFLLGADPLAEPWALDNERGQHVVHVPTFRIGRHPVTNAAWARFVADGGYEERRWWTAPGWAHRVGAALSAPMGWAGDGAGGWTRRRFGAVEEVPGDEPVQHVCFHEAQAYAAWAGGRLPTEVEWEKACAWDPVLGRRRRWPWGERAPAPDLATVGGTAMRPSPVGSLPAGASAYGAEQMVGEVWEWTSSPFAPWPGFAPMLYADYSAPFFGDDHRVLRGGSWATGLAAVRPSFRNWDLPVRRQVFAGLRLAHDVDGGA